MADEMTITPELSIGICLAQINYAGILIVGKNEIQNLLMTSWTPPTLALFRSS